MEAENQTAGQKLESVLRAMIGRRIVGAPVAAIQQDGKWVQIGESTDSPLAVWISETLGHGGQAAVARGTLEDDVHSSVALRMELFDGNLSDPRRVAMLRASELSITQPERYPALLPVKQTFVARLPEALPVHPGAAVICDIAQLCQPLGAWLPQHPLDAAAAVQAWLPVAVTMDRLFESYGWVHRDIDEGNVLVSPDGRLRLADLGIVSIVEPNMTHKSTTLMGKRATLPPEGRMALFSDRPRLIPVRPSYDAWQLGRLLFIMITGGGASIGTHREDGSLILDPTPDWSGWDRIQDDELGGVIRGLVAADPEKRMRLGAATETLRNWVARQPKSSGQMATIPNGATHQSSPGPTRDSWPPAPVIQVRKGVPVLLAAVSAVAIVAITVAATLLMTRQDRTLDVQPTVVTVTAPAPNPLSPSEYWSSPSVEPEIQTPTYTPSSPSPSPSPSPVPPVMLDLVGRNVDTATTLLSESGLPDPRLKEVISTAAPGTVIEQSPSAGVENPSEVALTVSGATAKKYLSEMEPVSGDYIYKGEIGIAGKSYANSVWHELATCEDCNKETQYNLGKDYEQLRVTLGVGDDAQWDKMNVLFEIYLDGEQVFGPKLRLGESKSLVLPVKDGLRLILKTKPPSARDRNNDYWVGKAGFGNAVLIGLQSKQ